ncbi:putative quinol monooxygenase [Salsuginibacillus kocurii]|uniref:putative quinol monooxygenase n=1 Tax=Salsuginibacillus kocurii TaxID=427078 RepID=UPI00036BA02D|nr:putative quinol monooxygenase [Salsuginibacillus kocurii]
MQVIHAHMKVKSENREEFLERVQSLIKESQAEEGNISYDLYEDVSEPNKFVMLEEWRDEDAVEYHFQTPHFAHFGDIAENLLEGAPEVKRFEVNEKR